MNVKAQISVRYQLLHNSVAVLHKFIGPDYLTSVVNPEIGSQARQVISQYTAQEVYTSRDQIQKQIRDAAQKSLSANLNKLVQPEAMEQPDPKHYNDFLQDAIQILDTLVLVDRTAAGYRLCDQPADRTVLHDSGIQIPRASARPKRSKRKQIEADGIAAFQKTVSQGISESYLRWRGIEATLLLAQSPNAKIVVIGTGKDGLPIILGNADVPTVPPGGQPQAGSNGAPSSASGSPGSTGNAPPAPAGNAPPNTSTAPGVTPGAPAPNKPPPGTSGAATPTAPEQTANASSASPVAQPGQAAPAATAFDIPGVRSILSGISGALRAGADLTSPEPKSKQ